MDRIDSMTHAELKAATRKLVEAGRKAEEWHGAGHYNICVGLREALAAFDPSPADIACKALEDAGFVETQCGDLCHAIVIPNSAARNIYYKLKDKA